MRDPSIKSYVPPFLLGKPLVSAGIAEVVKSSNPKLQTGDHIWGMWEFSEYQVVEEEGLKGVKKVEKSGELSWNVSWRGGRWNEVLIHWKRRRSSVLRATLALRHGTDCEQLFSRAQMQN